MKNQMLVRTTAMGLAAVLFTGCAHKSVKSGMRTNAASGDQIASASPIEASRGEPDLRNDSTLSIPELKTVYFDYDSDHLKPEARAVLASNAGWLKEHDDRRVQIAGNCDQRGTVEYNLALGQRRAASVREYYIHMGVSGGRIATISYGKEHLVCQESTEACWQKNRRAETLEAVSKNISRK